MCVALGSGFVMSALLAACKTPLGVLKTTAQNDVVLIPVAEFSAAAYKLIRVSNYNYDLAIQRLPDGSYLTLVLKCSHAGHPLTKTGDKYYCTLHGSQFSHEGNVLKGPAESSLTILPTEVVGELVSIRLNHLL